MANSLVITCDCRNLDHIMQINTALDDLAYLEVRLNPLPRFLDRLVLAYRYLFKREKANYDTLILTPEKASEVAHHLLAWSRSLNTIQVERI